MLLRTLSSQQSETQERLSERRLEEQKKSCNLEPKQRQNRDLLSSLPVMFSLGVKLYNLAVGKKRAAPDDAEEELPQTVRAKIIHRSTLSSDKMVDLPTVPAPVEAEAVVAPVKAEAVTGEEEEDATAPDDAPPSQESSDDGRTPGTPASELQTLKACYANGNIPTTLSGEVVPAFTPDDVLNDKVIAWSVWSSLRNCSSLSCV